MQKINRFRASQIPTRHVKCGESEILAQIVVLWESLSVERPGLPCVHGDAPGRKEAIHADCCIKLWLVVGVVCGATKRSLHAFSLQALLGRRCG